MAMTTYFDFAENDYEYFMASYHHGLVANAMAADAQEICEKYMKHMLNQYFVPETQEEQLEYDSIMRTHNLGKLMRFLAEHLDIHFDNNSKNELRIINGYYFTARYPGDESVEIQREDIELCASAARHCREQIIKYIRNIENELNKENPKQEEMRR
jgi:HEPN domain-containing protein